MKLLLFWAIRLLASTWRFKRHGDGNWKERLCSGEVVVHWHGHLLPLFFAHKGLPFLPIVSKSTDGEILAEWLKKLGYSSIRGSSSNGGDLAYQQAKTAAENGMAVVFAADGPRGPKHVAKPGAIRLSRDLSRPMLLLSIRVDSAWHFTSWDGFLLPKPFSVVHIFVGKPFCAAQNPLSCEDLSLRLLELTKTQSGMG